MVANSAPLGSFRGSGLPKRREDHAALRTIRGRAIEMFDFVTRDRRPGRAGASSLLERDFPDPIRTLTARPRR
jgi:hypothetical protein